MILERGQKTYLPHNQHETRFCSFDPLTSKATYVAVTPALIDPKGVPQLLSSQSDC